MKLINGDTIEEMSKLEDKSIDMILADLPYGTTRNKWDSIIPLDKLWEQYNRIIKDNGAIVLFGQQPFTSLLVASNLKMYRYDWVWEKSKATGHLNSKKMPLKSFETISIFYKALPKYNPQGLLRIKPTIRKGRNNGSNYGVSDKDSVRNFKNYPKDVLRFSSPSKHHHPTEKPVELIEYLIKTYSNENDIVLDNTMGSGSTGVACVNTNRDFIGIELDKNYFNIAESRIGKQ